MYANLGNKNDGREENILQNESHEWAEVLEELPVYKENEHNEQAITTVHHENRHKVLTVFLQSEMFELPKSIFRLNPPVLGKRLQNDSNMTGFVL